MDLMCNLLTAPYSETTWNWEVYFIQSSIIFFKKFIMDNMFPAIEKKTTKSLEPL